MELPRNQQWATLGQGRYSVRVSPSLAYEVSVPNETRAFEGRFLNTPPPGGLVGSIVWVAPAPAGDTRLPRHPCRDHTPTPVGPTVADLATALTQQPALDVSDPEPVTVDGNDGLSINVSNPDNLDISTCEDDTVALFSTGSDDWGWDEDFQGRWHILDVDGERVVIKDQCSYCAKSHSRAAQQMIESITFHPSE